MAIKSTATSVQLSGDDAVAFLRQVDEGPSLEQARRASATLARGRAIVRAYLKRIAAEAGGIETDEDA